MSEITRYSVPSVKIKNLKKVMENKVISVQKDDTLEDLVTKFRKYEFNGFPVLDRNELVGVVTKTDLMKILTITERKMDRIFASHVRDIMTHHPTTVTPETDLTEIVDIMNNNRVRTLPVLKSGKLKAILSYSDLVKNILVV